MDHLVEFLSFCRSWIWSPPLLLLILGTGVYYTVALKGIQFRYLVHGFKQTFYRRDSDAAGDISHFESLMTSLAGAIGTGSITGVATGIAVGGMGAVFWIWVTALFGMAIRYAEALLSVKYRSVDANSEMVGGPMAYIEKGLGWPVIATLFALFGVIACFGTGNLVQVNSIADALQSQMQIPPVWTGAVLMVVTGAVLIGGVKSIGFVAACLVPVMALFYLGGGLAIIAWNIALVPDALRYIVESAFSGQAAAGGFLGASVMVAIQSGVARSILASEAGLGISSVASAAAKTDHPGRQAMVSMTGVFLSAIVVCTVTGLLIGISGLLGSVDNQGVMISGATLAIHAFEKGFPGSGIIVTIGLILFAYSTVIAWAYYGEKCAEYLFGEASEKPFRVLYCLLIIPGAMLDLRVVWLMADVANGLMAIPNLCALIGLCRVVKEETKDYLSSYKDLPSSVDLLESGGHT